MIGEVCCPREQVLRCPHILMSEGYQILPLEDKITSSVFTEVTNIPRDIENQTNNFWVVFIFPLVVVSDEKQN